MKCVHLSLFEFSPAVLSLSPFVGELFTFQFLIMADETDNCNKTLFLVQLLGTDTTAARTLQYKMLQTTLLHLEIKHKHRKYWNNSKMKERNIYFWNPGLLQRVINKRFMGSCELLTFQSQRVT